MQLLAPVTRAVRLAFRGRDLAWTLSAWGCYIAAEQGLEIALVIYAYGQGGIKATGLLALARSLVAASTAPFTAGLGDRFSRRAVLIVVAGATAAVVAAMSASVWVGLGPWPVYALATAAAVVIPTYRPVQAAMLPQLSSTPAQLTAANVTVSMLEGVGNLAGPVLAGALIMWAGVEYSFLALAALSAVTAAAAARIAAQGRPATRAERPPGRPLTGFGTVIENADVRVLIGTFTVSMLVWGAFFQVLLVAVAVQRLGVNSGATGLLASAAGVGAIIGAVGSASLVGRRRLVPAMTIGVAAWSAALLALALTTATVVAYAMVIVPGAGLVLMDVVTFTLLQRAADDELLARVFGVLESMMRAAIGLGAVGVALLASNASLSTTLIVVAALQPIGLAVAWRGLRRVDRLAGAPPERIALLRSIEMFAYLTPAGMERVASHLEPVQARRGDVVIRQGDVGDRVYLVEGGALQVLKDGSHVADLGPGSMVGEIALLRDVLRTATVVASIDSDLYALGRDEFLRTVAGDAAVRGGADTMVDARLTELESLGAQR
ncbi:MAG TPA: MFS transporter [Gaiellales bacterium]|nr:MFS transporter [Gaiellales bacterium]